MGPGEPAPLTLDDFRQRLQQLGRDLFLKRHTAPVLVLQRLAHDDDDDDDDSSSGFHTAVFDGQELQQLLETAPEAAGQTVFQVRKRAGGAFPDRIGVGRARNTDVCLPFPEISKYHAFFSPSDDPSRYLLTDAGSSNGTWVGGTKLQPREPHEVCDGDEVFFGPYGFVLYLPEGFCRLLRGPRLSRPPGGGPRGSVPP